MFYKQSSTEFAVIYGNYQKSYLFYKKVLQNDSEFLAIIKSCVLPKNTFPQSLTVLVEMTRRGEYYTTV